MATLSKIFGRKLLKLKLKLNYLSTQHIFDLSTQTQTQLIFVLSTQTQTQPHRLLEY